MIMIECSSVVKTPLAKAVTLSNKSSDAQLIPKYPDYLIALVSAGFELLRTLKSSFMVPRASGA
jgi:hypothetical protein